MVRVVDRFSLPTVATELPPPSAGVTDRPEIDTLAPPISFDASVDRTMRSPLFVQSDAVAPPLGPQRRAVTDHGVTPATAASVTVTASVLVTDAPRRASENGVTVATVMVRVPGRTCAATAMSSADAGAGATTASTPERATRRAIRRMSRSSPSGPLTTLAHRNHL